MLGNANEDSGNTINLKLISTKGPDATDFPKFIREVKDGDKYTLDEDQSYTKVSGVVESIKTTHNGKTGNDEVKGFRLVLVDGEEKYRIDSTMKQASKDIVNVALANVGKKINISLWLNNGGYPSASLKDDAGEHLPVKYKFDPKKPLDLNQLWADIEGQEPADADNLPF